jgi:hypothetical protein
MSLRPTGAPYPELGLFIGRPEWRGARVGRMCALGVAAYVFARPGIPGLGACTLAVQHARD